MNKRIIGQLKLKINLTTLVNVGVVFPLSVRLSEPKTAYKIVISN